MANNKVNLTITFKGDKVAPKILQNETIAFMQYLKSSRLDLSVTQASTVGDTESVTKGDPVTWGALLLVVAPAIIPQILAFIEKMITEGRKIEVQAPNGAKIVFVPRKKMSQEEITSFIKELNKIKPLK